MITYRELSLRDLDEAHFNFEHGRYQSAVFFFQQFAENSAKALLEKKDLCHEHMKSHEIEVILEAYDEMHKTSELSDKAKYLSNFYLNTRYPSENYIKINK